MRRGQNYTHDIIRQRAFRRTGNIEISGRIEFIGNTVGQNRASICNLEFCRKGAGTDKEGRLLGRYS